MSDDRTSIPMDREVFRRLKSQKGQYESWNQYLVALADLAAEHHDPPTLESDGTAERPDDD